MTTKLVCDVIGVHKKRLYWSGPYVICVRCFNPKIHDHLGKYTGGPCQATDHDRGAHDAPKWK